MEPSLERQISAQTGFKWHEVTWYSKLGAIILLCGVVPALAFYIGMQFAQVNTQTTPAAATAVTDKIETTADLYTSQNGIDGWKTYASPTAPGGFEFQYPSTWQMNEQLDKEFSLTLSANDNPNKNLQSNIYIAERIDKNCYDRGTKVTIDGKGGFALDWVDHGSPNFFMTREVCLLDYNDGLTFLMFAYSPEAQQAEDKLISTFHFPARQAPAGE